MKEERDYITIAHRLYLSGTSQKSAWCFKDCLFFVCKVTVSVSLSFWFLFFFFVLVLVLVAEFGASQGKKKSPPQGCYTPLFIEGECLGF